LTNTDAEKRAALNPTAAAAAKNKTKNNSTGASVKPKVVKFVEKNGKAGSKLIKTSALPTAGKRSANINNLKMKAIPLTKTSKTMTKPAAAANKKVKVITTASGLRLTTSTSAKPQSAKTSKFPKNKLDSALETARAVSRNKNHANHTEVQRLLESYEKGWTPKDTFVELLPGLLGLK
jgi:hypothetical protein